MRDKLNYITLILLNTCLLLSCTNTDSKNTREGYRYYITWRNYDYENGDSPASATYIWSGQEVGTGDDGFNVVLKKMAEVPEGESIYIFPVPNWDYVRPDRILDVLPFGERVDEFMEIESSRNLRIVEAMEYPKTNLDGGVEN